MNQPATYLLITEVKVEPKAVATYIKDWQEVYSNALKKKCLYLNEEGVLLEITAIEDLSKIEAALLNQQQENFEERVNRYLLSDWRKQVLVLKESVKAQATHVPNTPYLQLRHIEVPLSVHKEYLTWREQTIFSHVRKQITVDSFLAYHSILSAEPGVMFLSGFTCEIDDYLAGFKTPEYQDIVKQAGSKYISGGEKGLYTKIYRNVIVN